MERPTMNATEAVHQAGTTINAYLRQAQQSIDDLFGSHYAKAHPNLMAACIQAQGSDFYGANSVCLVYALLDRIDTLIHELQRPMIDPKKDNAQ